MNVRALLAFGSNESTPDLSTEEIVSQAILAVEALSICKEGQSALYRTPAVPSGSGPDYVNAAAAFRFDCAPQQLLTKLHDIEADFGRLRDVRWGQRTLDVDLLAINSEILPDRTTFLKWKTLPLNRQTQESPAQLILPHPRIQDRAFVLVPLAEVASDWVHPVLGQSVTEMLNNLPKSDVDQVVRL